MAASPLRLNLPPKANIPLLRGSNVNKASRQRRAHPVRARGLRYVANFSAL